MKIKLTIILTSVSIIFLCLAIALFFFTVKLTNEEKALIKNFNETNKNYEEIMRNTVVPMIMVSVEYNIQSLEELDKKNVNEGKRLLIEELSSFYHKWNDEGKNNNPNQVNDLIKVIEHKAKDYDSFARILKKDYKTTNNEDSSNSDSAATKSE